MSGDDRVERCSWCGERIERDDGYRVGERPGERRAAFCRLEHVVPWAIRGAHWEAGDPDEPYDIGDSVTECAHCGDPLGEVQLLLVRHRGEHRIPDGFCSVDHLSAWAAAGGRYAR